MNNNNNEMSCNARMYKYIVCILQKNILALECVQLKFCHLG